MTTVRQARFLLGLVCLVVTVLTAALLSAAFAVPALTGWHRVALTSGSMEPSIRTGDVVLADPHLGRGAGPGTVLVFTDPARPGGLVTHRVVEALPEGSFRTQGDANPTPDSTLVTQDMVVGQGRVLVPLVGLPAAWRASGQPERSAVALGLVLFAGWGSRWALLARFDPYDGRTPSPTRPPSRVRPPAPRPARVLVAPRAFPVLAVALLAALAVAPQPSRAAFVGATGNAGSALATGPFSQTYFLRTSSTTHTAASSPLPLTAAAPTLTTLFNYDVGRDSEPGLSLAKGGSLTATDPTRIQRWNLPVTSRTTLSGTASLRLWSAVRGFQTNKPGALTAGLFDCDVSGASCTQLVAQSMSGSAWGTEAGWLETRWSLGAVSHTIEANRVLQLRIAVPNNSSDTMWLAYDTTAHPSAVTIG